ncbi:MAG: potassium channel family protein [Patescibacteria group bacterium]
MAESFRIHNNHKHIELRLKLSLFLLAVIISAAALFYRSTEGWSLINSLYFAVSTASTVGYGDLTPSHEISKIFTIVFIILSTTLTLYSISLVAQKGIILHMHKKEEEK